MSAYYYVHKDIDFFKKYGSLPTIIPFQFYIKYVCICIAKTFLKVFPLAKPSAALVDFQCNNQTVVC